MEPLSLSSDTNVNEDIVGSASSLEEILHALSKHGCSDLAESIDWAACKETPYALGGFCDVFQGALRNGTKVAIKRLRTCDGPESEGDSEKGKMLKRSARELYHWSKLRHCNVLPLMGLVVFRGHISMVSEWVENGNLMVYLRQNPDADRKNLCMDVCMGLCYIHENNMTHGDLKAANVMVTSDGRAMIADFGNAKLKDLTLMFSHTRKIGFSIRWAAPELLLEDDCPQLSKEADVYAYGMTALEILTGKVPYEGISDNRVLAIVAYERKVPSRPETDISHDLWRVVSSCWTWEPSKRPGITSIKYQLQALFPSPSPEIRPTNAAAFDWPGSGRFVLERYHADMLLRNRTYFVIFPCVYCFDENRIICRITEGFRYRAVDEIKPNPPVLESVFYIQGIPYWFDSFGVLWYQFEQEWLMETLHEDPQPALDEVVRCIENNKLHLSTDAPNVQSPASDESLENAVNRASLSSPSFESDDGETLRPLSSNPDQANLCDQPKKSNGFVLERYHAKLLLRNRTYFTVFPCIYCFDENRIICRITEGFRYQAVDEIKPNPPVFESVFHIQGVPYWFDSFGVLWYQFEQEWLMETMYSDSKKYCST